MIHNSVINFKETTSEDTRKLMDCVKKLYNSDDTSDSLRRKMGEYFSINAKKDSINKKVLELIRYGDYGMHQIDDLISIAIQHPNFINDQLKMYKK